MNGFHWDKQYLRANSLDKNKIVFFSLEMSPQCYAKCLYCFSGPELNKEVKEPLTFREYKKIITEGKELGVKTVVFPGIGEPFLDEKLKPLIEFAHKLGLVSVIYTCGIIDEEMIQFLKNHNVTLIVKIDSLNKSHYEKLVGIAYEKFRKSLDQIIKLYTSTFSEYNGCILTRLAANTVVTNINKNDIAEIAAFCEKYNIKHFVEELSKTGWAKDNWKELVGDNWAELKEIAWSYGNWVSSATMDNRCGLFAHGITIDANGDLLGCPTARWIKLGNIRKNLLQDLVKIYRHKIHSLKPHYCLARELTLSEEG
ncbi:MAG: radical SAM protein [Candidatus Aminicenantes bacterium]|nr:radical SAM protein [Candidatus Aminicenantes bacterium]